MKCNNCNKEIKYSLFANDYPEITNSGLCSNGLNGCYEIADSWINFYPKEN